MGELLLKGVVVAFLLGFCAALKAQKTTQRPCPNVEIQSPSKIDFNSNELLFICGKGNTKEWQAIPFYQIKFHLKGILGTRGYHFVDFVEEKGRLIVDTGPVVKVTAIVYEEIEKMKWMERYTTPIGMDLTPNTLDLVEDFVREKSAIAGDPCAEFEVLASARTGIVKVIFKSFKKRFLVKVDEEYDERFSRGVFRRFYAFQLGKLYDARLMELTSRRIFESGIALHNRLDAQCLGDEVIAKQNVILGERRLFTVGVGASTEVGPLGRVTWKNARVGMNASQLEVRLLASFRQQRINFLAPWYPLANLPRFHLLPQASYAHDEEDQYETFTGRVSAPAVSSYDNQGMRIEGSTGPSINYYNTIRGLAPDKQTYLSWVSEVTFIGHQFEYYATDPRNGVQVRLFHELISENVVSEFSAQKLQINFHLLSNYKELEPPVFIFGLRGKISTSITEIKRDRSFRLPLNFRYFLGGTDDLRGFSRKELPVNALGALTSFNLSLEVRNLSLVGPRLQPLIFADFGALGDESGRIQEPYYWSPGIGLRWDSAIGIFRATGAHGYLISQNDSSQSGLSHGQLYLSYGKEF